VEKMASAINKGIGFGKGRENVDNPELESIEGDGMDFVKRAPCCFPIHLEDEAQVIDEWLLSRKCSKR